MYKTDIQHAYKLIVIHPDEVPALGIRWFQHWLWDCTLAMGARSGCSIFEMLSKALQHVAEFKGCGPMCHILDDFLLVTEDNSQADKKFGVFQRMCDDVGIPLVQNKTEKGTCLVFMGIELDSEVMQALLPREKLDRCLGLVVHYQTQRTIAVKQLESLAGLLNFACSVVPPGRPFMRRLFQMLWGMRRCLPYYKLRLSQGAKKDLVMWESFLRQYNGVTMFLPNEPLLDTDIELQIAVSDGGLAVVLGQAWWRDSWPQEWKDRGLFLKDIFVILVMMAIFGSTLANKRIRLHTISKDLTQVINSQSVKDPLAMILIRDLVLLLLINNTHLAAEQVEEQNNKLAFSLSINQMDHFRLQHPDSNMFPERIPLKYRPERYRLI
jgi:hypothetical protein